MTSDDQSADDQELPLSRCPFLADKERVQRRGDQRWRDPSTGRCYTLDRLHGEVEVYTARGYHLGAVDPVTGEFVKGAVKGRRIDV